MTLRSTAHLAGLDQRLEPGARQGGSTRGRRSAQETIEPLARAGRIDLEELRP